MKNLSNHHKSENCWFDVKETLAKTITAAESQNWLQVTQNLSQLPLVTAKNQSFCLSETELDRLIDLALQVFYLGDFQQKWSIVNLFSKLTKRLKDCSEMQDMIEKPLVRAIEILEDRENDPELHWFAIRILGEFDRPKAILSLAKVLRDAEDEELSIMASEALTRIGNSAIETITNLLEDENTRLLAVKCLSGIRKVETIEPLLKVVKDSRIEVRITAIEALSSFHDPRIPIVLMGALADTSAAVRKEAVIALGLRSEFNSELDLVSNIEPLLFDLNLEVNCQAAIALGRIGTESAIEALFNVLQSSLTPISLQIHIVRALSWSETDLALEYLQQALAWSNERVCQEIVTLLGREAKPNLKDKATQILLDFLNSGQAIANLPTIRKTLAMSIGELGQSRAIIFLHKLAEDSEAGVRLHAIAALKKLTIETATS